MEVISVVIGDQAADAFVNGIPEHIPTLLLPRELVSKLVGFEFHSGILACGQRNRLTDLSSIQATLSSPKATVVICPYTHLPENIGSIIRLCTGFGVSALIVGKRGADPFSRRSIRVSMGNIFNLPIVEPEDIISVVEALKSNFEFCILAATGGANATSLPLPRPGPRLGLVLGHEATGVSPELIEISDREIAIRMSGGTDSLNVAQAAAVLLYQFTRVCSD